jgi:O-antigen/teichoic acid export membrane protein
VAARPASAPGLLHQWLRCRLLASLLVMMLVAVGIAVAGLPWPQRAPLVLLTVAGLAAGLVELIHHAFRGLGRTDLESAISLGQRAASLVLGLAALWWRPEVTLLALVLIVPPLAALGISLAAAARVAARANASPAFVPPVSWQEFRRDVAPIGIGILISALYFRIDTFLIDWLDGTARVGLYAAVFRIVDALRLLPAAALAVALPALCRAADLRVAMMLAARLTAVALVGAAVAAVAAPWLIPAMYGPAYAAAVPAFRVLLIGFPLMTLNYVLTQQLVAWNGHVAFAGLAAVALAVNVAANLALIPSASIAGAAWSTVWTEVTITIGCTVILGTGQHRRSAASSPEGVPWQEA